MGCGNSTCSNLTANAFESGPSSKGERCPIPKSPLADGQRNFHDTYLVTTKLGKGAFASVHLAQKIGTNEKLAVKVTDLRAQKNGGSFNGPVDPKRRQATVKEIQMLEAVDGKEHIIRLHDAFMEGSLSYIVLEKCDHTLLQVLERIPDLTEFSIKRILCEMLKGLAASHGVGVVHRDVKPDNFLCVGESATVKLCDFGLAALMPAPNQGAGLSGIYGTPPFMAPEMLRGVLYGPKVDTWSFGVIAYVLLFGQFPYRPAEQTGPAMKAAILAGSPPPSFTTKYDLEGSGNAARISSNAIALLRELLCRVPEDRPTAEQALECSFFRTVPNPGKQMGSLRPMLFAAKRVGAFDVRASKPQTTDVDLRLVTLQEKRHGSGSVDRHISSEGKDSSHQRHGGSERRKPRVLPSDTSTDAGSALPSDGAATDGSNAMM